ncbi:PREDICTED: WAT1-related protein At1g09380 [Tarenaya hassleriana]|uniref:WAT1-related protein At1g09380 n=1 Tax=Tarenaya hassleriana TaxID=28532 RepID=UPI00053C3A97|nr:PREDICTED: WAT1-related protein At1g09380 [Tarenaya hassleriana]
MVGGDMLPFLAMVLVQIGYAGMNITSKMAMEAGMKPLILVAYRQIFATVATFPVAYFIERKTRPKVTLNVLVQAFFCSVTGVTGNQVFYFVGLQNSSPTIACALTNLLPAVTFLLAAIFRQEVVGIKKKSGQAKVVGTIVCVAGAMLLSFYHGHTIGIGESKIHWTYAEKISSLGSSSNGSSFFLGPFLVMAGAVSWAAWFILQTKMGETFAAPYTSTLLMCLMGSIQCGGIALISDHKLSDWSLRSPIRVISAVYAGVVASALAFCLMSWTIQKRGPLYVSVFSPMLLVVVAIISWALLQEKLYLGTLVGSALVVIGLYGVLWGKDKETADMEQTQELKHNVKTDQKEDVESRLSPSSPVTDHNGRVIFMIHQDGDREKGRKPN